MTDKERDDALIAEVVETLRDARTTWGLLLPGNKHLPKIDALLAKLQPAPNPDRAEALLKDVRCSPIPTDKVLTAIIRRHFDELRAEWEAERPAVVVPEAVREAAGFNYLEGTYAETLARFVLSLIDGAKGDE